MGNGLPSSFILCIAGYQSDATAEEIRSTYWRLAVKWHPDRRQRQQWLLDEANRKFQVLSDEKKRPMYDSSFHQSNFDDREYVEVEGFLDLMEGMMELISKEKRELTEAFDCKIMILFVTGLVSPLLLIFNHVY